jgi:catechol 2,3-dioxygenase-like lactoylglutathione lyase family enzyme
MPQRMPFELEGLDHVVLLVRDMSEARRFYEEVLGCTVDRELPQYGMLQLRAGASLIDLVDICAHEGEWARPEVEGGRNLDHVCISTGPCDEQAMRAHLSRHGIDIVEEGVRYGAKGDGMSFYIRDPSGNQIELKSPLGS